MGIFKRRANNTAANQPPAVSQITDRVRQSMFSALRSVNPAVPALTRCQVAASIPIGPMTIGGPSEGALDGWVFETWNTGDPGLPFAACVFRHDGQLETWIGCSRGHQRGDTLIIAAMDGSTSRQGPLQKRFEGIETWTSDMLSLALFMLSQQTNRGRETDGARRVRAYEHRAFVRFAETAPNRPLVEEWRVSECVDPTHAGGYAVEFWTDTVDTPSTPPHPPNPYQTPLVAAQFAPDGSITAMVAMETMPDLHDDAYLIAFGASGRRNFGARKELLDPSAFREVALQMLLH